jgi:hypothetical protein
MCSLWNDVCPFLERVPYVHKVRDIVTPFDCFYYKKQ